MEKLLNKVFTKYDKNDTASSIVLQIRTAIAILKKARKIPRKVKGIYTHIDNMIDELESML